jgi:RNA polymerase sigma-70 factor (ECF subfamily)
MDPRPTEATEEMTWLQAAREGDHFAFGRIVSAHSARVAATVKGMLGETAEVEDVGQEVFISFYRSLHRFRGDASIATFLTRIAINLAINEIKKRNRWFRVSTPAGADDLDRQADPGDGPDLVQKKNRIRAAIRALPVKYRSVIVLRLLQEYSTEETAAILDLPPGTVQSRLSRGQKKLREMLVPPAGGKP